jgi:hypothetical protein
LRKGERDAEKYDAADFWIERKEGLTIFSHPK